MARSKVKSPMQQSPSNASRSVRRLSPRNGIGSKGSGRSLANGLERVNGNNKRPKSSPVTGESSSSENPGNDTNDDSSEGDDDADADEPASFAPSYGNKKRRKGHKTGLQKQRLSLSNGKSKKRVKQFREDSDVESDFGENTSISSVSSVSQDNLAKPDDSDDVYEGVDDVSEGDDADVEKEEEELILQSEYERELDFHASNFRTPDDWMGLDDLENRPFYSAGSFFDDDHFFMPSEHCDVVVEAAVASEAVETPVPRRVHFESSEDSSDSDKTSDDDYLDFLQQDSLDPDIRRMIENDSEPKLRSRSPHSLFVNNDFYDPPGNIYHVESETSVESSSEYETEGETTDEEDHPPPATITHPRSILRRESSASLTPECESSNQSSQPLRKRGPLRGTFVADPHKPVAVVAPNGRQLILIPPYASSRHDWLASASNSLAPTADNSPRNSISMANHPPDDSETDAVISPVRRDSTPMLSTGANLMMSALQNNPGGQVMGPPEAFYPNAGNVIDGNFDDDDDDDSEAMLNVDDFLDFGDGSSDEDIAKELEEPDCLTSPVVSSSIPASLVPTPNRVTDGPQANNTEQFLNHLDRGVVTAFRRNHNRYEALIRLPQHREFMPANSPSRPASAFRRSKLSDQKTPTRKRQASSYLGGDTVRRKLMDSHRLNTSAFP